MALNARIESGFERGGLGHGSQFNSTIISV